MKSKKEEEKQPKHIRCNDDVGDYDRMISISS